MARILSLAAIAPSCHSSHVVTTRGLRGTTSSIIQLPSSTSPRTLMPFTRHEVVIHHVTLVKPCFIRNLTDLMGSHLLRPPPSAKGRTGSWARLMKRLGIAGLKVGLNGPPLLIL